MAFLMGTVAASSLLIGAAMGLFWKPSRRTTAAIMAFGAGILIAALAFELVQEAYRAAGFLPMAVGALIGGGTFSILNHVLNKKGAFGRKQSTTKKFLRDRKRREASEMLERLANVELLRHLPPEEMDALIPRLESLRMEAGADVFKEGQEPDGLYLIETGKVEVVKGWQPQREGQRRETAHAIAMLEAGDAFGEMALLVKEKRTASVKCVDDCRFFRLKRKSFDELMKISPSLSMALSRLLAKRLDKTSARHVESEREKKKWKDMALTSVDQKNMDAMPGDVNTAAVVVSSAAPFAIWLGILMDGIPECAVIGASIGPGKMVGIALLAGVFLSNIPEALSSAVGMRSGGHSRLRIMLMWGSLVILSGLWAAAGNFISHSSTEVIIAVVQGLGAGAMLTMVAETMLPEAFEQGGSVVGISTLTGFLLAYFLNGL
ncbi:MAG: cyclic nucleotide-binding domain-containing protein [Pseudomonadota bacterium]